MPYAGAVPCSAPEAATVPVSAKLMPRALLTQPLRAAPLCSLSRQGLRSEGWQLLQRTDSCFA